MLILKKNKIKDTKYTSYLVLKIIFPKYSQSPS